MTKLEFVEL